MQSTKKILEELGFNKDAPLDAQKAFLKHLVAAANQTRPMSMPLAQTKKDQSLVEKETPYPNKPKDMSKTIASAKAGTQLEFEFPEDKRVS